MIFQCNPRAAYEAQASAIDAAIRRVLLSERYILGPEVTAFETEFAAYVGAGYALGVANGTDALAIALKTLGVGHGDVVLTVSHTAVATIVAIRATGASPLFVEVDEHHGLMDLDVLEAMLIAIRERGSPVALDRVKAIVPVHLYGRAVDMNRLVAIASGFSLPLVEDCAQAHGARFGDRPVGSFGAFGCFSFYPTKNLGAIGDGGALVTSDPHLLEQARLQREYGWRLRYISDIEGGNSRLDELQAALLRVKLTRLDADNAARVAIAAAYRSKINHPSVDLPPAAPHGQHVYHQFAVRCSARETLQTYLKNKGIGTLVHYPRAVHEQPAYADRSFAPFPLPRTETWSRNVLSLPMFPQLAMTDVDYIAASINDWDGQA
jgi:dTDP-4-amino-4,6-dideoxygalactose transaminase